MKGDGIKNWWGGLSSNAKFVVIIISALILWYMYRQFKGSIESIGINAQSSGALATLSTQGVKPSYDSQTYATWADRLEYAMDGAGTDEEIIYKVYGYMHNDADIVKLNQVFGIRSESTLNEWIKGDMSTSDIAKINTLLRDKGITKTIK